MFLSAVAMTLLFCVVFREAGADGEQLPWSVLRACLRGTVRSVLAARRSRHYLRTDPVYDESTHCQSHPRSCLFPGVWHYQLILLFILSRLVHTLAFAYGRVLAISWDERTCWPHLWGGPGSCRNFTRAKVLARWNVCTINEKSLLITLSKVFEPKERMMYKRI